MKFVLLFISVAIPLIGNCQVFTRATYNLRGKVKSVVSRSYQTRERNGKVMEGMQQHCFPVGTFVNASFSPQGLMEELTYDFDCSLINIGLKYNTENQFVEKWEWVSPENKFLTATFEYDTNGCFSKITQFYGIGENNYVIYTYKNDGKKNSDDQINDTYSDWYDFKRFEDESSGDYPNDFWCRWYLNNGQAVEMNYLNAANSDTRYTYLFEFDENGNQLKQYPRSVASECSDLNNVLEYKYDINGRRTHKKAVFLTKNRETDSVETRLRYEIFYEHDDKGRLTRKNIFVADADTIIPHTTLKIYYTEKGKTLEYTNLHPQRSKEECLNTIHSYNIYGDLVRSQYVYPEKSARNSIKNYVYTYDQHKNWTKVLMYSDEEPQTIINREIIYR